MPNSKVDTINYWGDDIPDKYDGATIVAVLTSKDIPVAFWFGTTDGRAYYCCANCQRYYDLQDPNAVVPYIMKAAKDNAAANQRKLGYFTLSTSRNRSLQDHYVDRKLKARIKTRVQRSKFHLRGGGVPIMGSDDDDDLLAALDIADDEPDRTRGSEKAKPTDESKIAPHRRSNPPNKIRTPQDYLSTLKG